MPLNFNNISTMGLRTPKQEEKSKVYTVENGDNLTKIAKRFGVSVADILKVNPKITDANKISAGETIRMPAPATDSSSKKMFNTLREEPQNTFTSGPNASVTRESIFSAHNRINK